MATVVGGGAVGATAAIAMGAGAGAVATGAGAGVALAAGAATLALGVVVLMAGAASSIDFPGTKIGATVGAAFVAADNVAAVGAPAAAMTGAEVAFGVAAGVAPGERAGGAAATVVALTALGAAVSALSLGVAAVGARAVGASFLVLGTDVDAAGGPPRSSHADAAISASTATATPIMTGMRDDDSAPVMALLASTCERASMGLNGTAASDCASPSFANRSSAVCTSISGIAILGASCATEAGVDSRASSFRWRIESPADPNFFSSNASVVALHRAAVSSVDMQVVKFCFSNRLHELPARHT